MISNTRKSVSSDIQTIRSWLKKNSGAPRFFNPLLSVWIFDETLFLVFDILLPSKHKLNTIEVQVYKFEGMYKTWNFSMSVQLDISQESTVN